MIEVRLSVTITAHDDDQADLVLRRMASETQVWPDLPIVSITEQSRELVR